MCVAYRHSLAAGYAHQQDRRALSAEDNCPRPWLCPLCTTTMAIQPLRTLSIDNLVALAVTQNRLQEARKIFWRSKGQPIAHLPTFRACLEHALTGGARAATLGFGLRACFNVLLVLVRVRRLGRSQLVGALRHAVFGEDACRFAAMLGTFAAMYKLLINALPLVFPARDLQLSRLIGAQALPHPVYEAGSVDEITRRSSAEMLSVASPSAEQPGMLATSARTWHAALAGTVAGGLSILWEKRSRRIVLAQQLFVRGLQGVYTRQGVRIPHGAVFLFVLASGQIMYAFFQRPETMPRSYINWIQDASKAHPESFQYNRLVVEKGLYDPTLLNKVMAKPTTTASNYAALASIRQSILDGDTANVPAYLPCAGLHPMSDSCFKVAPIRFLQVALWMLPVYSVLHFLPALAFRWKAFRMDPIRMLARVAVGSLRSSAFLGMYVILAEAVWCIKHNLYEKIPISPLLHWLIPTSLANTLISSYSWYFTGFAAGLSLFIEDQRRHAELVMYVLPKALESLWAMVLTHRYPRVGRADTGALGDAFLSAIGCGMIMSIYQSDPQQLSRLLRSVLYQLIGPN
ncbi:hypothetical protein MKEN_00041000 [Mycena kentingensis (nom. inval.)]|nr:hypothetical protein MKEN_00041000 [Mycena kentingensis (nom. inval.)]